MGPERPGDPTGEEARLPLADLRMPAERRQALGDRLEALAHGRRRARWNRRMLFGAGAMAVGAALALLLVGRTPPSQLMATGGARLRTGPADFQLFPLGERGVAFVSEESDVELAPGLPATLRVHRGSVRLVVTRHHGEPFLVATEAAEVAVLGTEFDVTVVGHDTEVRVVHGEVEVRNDHGRRRLWPREAAHARVGEAPRMVVPMGAVVDGPAEILRQTTR
jgi:ferric-dicitrate binding protein FerR (iron transport regulator)